MFIALVALLFSFQDTIGCYDHYYVAVWISLVLYAPMILDALVEYVFQKNTAKEFSWPIQLYVVLIPNVYIYWRVIVPGLVPLVMYFQYIFDPPSGISNSTLTIIPRRRKQRFW